MCPKSSKATEALRQIVMSNSKAFLQSCELLYKQGYDVAQDPDIMQVIQQLQSFTPQYNLFSCPVPAKENPFRKLQLAVRAGKVGSEFPIGTRIPDTWTDTINRITYQMPLIVVDYRLVETMEGDLRAAAILMREHASPVALQFDQAEQRGATDARTLHGYNRFAQSALLQYLNSNKKKGLWWEAQSPCDQPAADVFTKDGYLCGCSPELLEVVKPIRLKIPYRRYIDNINVRFFIPSGANLGVSDENFDGKAKLAVWKYFQDCLRSGHGRCEERVFRSPNDGIPREFWLSDAYYATDTAVWTLTTTGGVYDQPADDTAALVSVCAVF